MVNTILVATDGSSLGNSALDMAADLAVKFKAELTILHVLYQGDPSAELSHLAEVEHMLDSETPPPETITPLPAGLMYMNDDLDEAGPAPEAVRILGKRIVTQALERAKDLGVETVSGEIVKGDTANEVLKAAEQIRAGLIVLGSKGTSPVKGLLLGSVSQKISHQAKCSCLLVR